MCDITARRGGKASEAIRRRVCCGSYFRFQYLYNYYYYSLFQFLFRIRKINSWLMIWRLDKIQMIWKRVVALQVMVMMIASLGRRSWRGHRGRGFARRSTRRTLLAAEKWLGRCYLQRRKLVMVVVQVVFDELPLRMLMLQVISQVRFSNANQKWCFYDNQFSDIAEESSTL